MSDTPTPRTDDATWHTPTSGDPIGADVVHASFAAGLERELAAVTKERDALRVHCTIADQTLDEMYGLTTRLGEAIASIDVLKDERDEWQAEADGIGEQLNKLSKQYAFALDERDAALTRIKRLEEAGEWMASARNEDDFNAAVKAWTQAKEAR